MKWKLIVVSFDFSRNRESRIRIKRWIGNLTNTNITKLAKLHRYRCFRNGNVDMGGREKKKRKKLAESAYMWISRGERYTNSEKLLPTRSRIGVSIFSEIHLSPCSIPAVLFFRILFYVLPYHISRLHSRARLHRPAKSVSPRILCHRQI